jgi:hypothetical protein
MTNKNYDDLDNITEEDLEENEGEVIDSLSESFVDNPDQAYEKAQELGLSVDDLNF